MTAPSPLTLLDWHRTRRVLCALFAGVLLSACDPGSKTPLDIGPHQGTLRIPAGWNVVNQGDKWEVRKGEASIVLHDLGPATPAAFQRQAARALALWWNGDAPAAQLRLSRLLASAQRFVPEPVRPPLVSTLLPLLESDARNLPAAELDARIADLDQAIAALETPSLDALADAALPLADHDRRRDIQTRTRQTVGDRPAVDFMTVTRSTQTYRKRIVIIENDGHLLALYFGILGHEAHLGEFDRVVRGLHFAPAVTDRR